MLFLQWKKLHFCNYKFRFKISLGLMLHSSNLLTINDVIGVIQIHTFWYKFYRSSCKKLFNNVTLSTCRMLPRENYQRLCNFVIGTYWIAGNALMKIFDIWGKFSPLHFDNYAVNYFWLLNKSKIFIFECRQDVVTHFSHVPGSFEAITFYTSSNFAIG